MASDVDIILDIAVNGVQDVFKLSNAMQQLNKAVNGVTTPMRNLDARSRALSKAVGASDSSLKNHARTISQLATNNSVLSNELKRVQTEIKGMGTSFKFATTASGDFRRAAVSDLKAYESALKSVRFRALIEDLRTVSQEQKRLGKDAQFVGRSLIIGLTTPIVAFGRVGLQSLVAIDREFVRLNKVLESVAPNLENAAKKMGIDLANATEAQNIRLNQMVNNYNELDKALTKISTKFGLSKSLTVGLAGEFAELGIQSTENIALITELTAVTEKLGGMDIANAKNLVESLYFQAQRAMQQSGQANRLTFEEREIAAIKAATTQLNMFNAVENVTALTLKDLGDAFPEVAAAGSSFGLSMTELAAMLAPMKAAGFEVGASANSIKVSLQRLTAPTKQNAELFKRLSKEYNTNFNEVKGIGLDAIQELIDGFNELQATAAGQEGAMEFFAKVFGVRQGPRMEVAISQMAAFDRVLKSADTGANTAEKRLQGFANTAIEGLNKTQNAGLPVIKSFSDIGIIARIATARVEAGQTAMVDGFGKVTQAQVKAAREVRKTVADEVFKASQAEGEDLIGQVATEAGRAMFIQLAGASNAAGVAQRELENALQSLDVKLAILRNNFKMFASELLKGIRPALEKISEVTTQLYEAWTRLTPEMKKRISTIVLAIAGLTASIGPLIFVFGQFRLAMGSVAGVLFKFLPSLKTMSVDAVAARSKMLNLTKPLIAMGDTVVNTNGKFATLIATIASGGGPLGKFAEKIGIVTGKLQKQTTAQIALTRQVMAQRALGATDPALGTGPISGFPTSGPFRGRLVRTAGGIIDPDDPTARISRAARKAFAEEEFSMEQQGLRRSGTYGTRYNVQQRFGMFGGRTGFRSIAAADVGEAIDLRQRGFDRTGITRTSPSASLGGGKLMRGGREISEERALRISRGGVIGRTVQAYDTTIASSSAALNKSLTAIKGAPQAAVNSYKKALLGAKTAQRLLLIETLAFTGTGPGAFARMRVAVLGFAKSFKVVQVAIKLTKILLISSGIGAVILAIGVAIMLIIKNMDQFKKSGASAFGGIKRIVSTLKDTAMGLIQPILDLFASFGNGADGAGGAISGVASAFGLIVKALEFVANIFKKFVLEIVQPYLYIIVNIVKFVVNLFQGKWSDALGALWAAFAGAFNLIAKIVLEIMGFLVKQVINLIFELPSAFMKAWAWGVEQATNLYIGFIEFIIGQAERIPVLGRFLGGVGRGALNMAKQGRDMYVGTIRTVANAVNSAGDFIKRGIDGLVDTAVDATGKLVKGGVKPGQGKLPGKKKTEVEDPEAELDLNTDLAQEQIANATGEGLEEGADAGSKALAKKVAQQLKEIKNELQQEIADRIKDQIKDVVDVLKDGLTRQKEASLAIYDSQIQKIEDVAKAEDKLTKEQQYQNKLREAEEQRALNRMNNRRNYLLAVYAGQIDEARAIADEGAREETLDTRSIAEIQQERTKEVAEENRKNLIESIKDAKKIAQDYFDDMIKNFTDAAKKITEFPPTTAEEFNSQLNALTGIATTAANSIGANFSESFNGVLATLGVDATGPLTSSLATISETLIKNNPFGKDGIWNKTIDDSIDALTRKYDGLINTLSIVIDDKSSRFKTLFETYKKYKAMVDEGASDGVGGGAGGGAGTGATPGGGAGAGAGSATDATKVAGFSREKINAYIKTYLDRTFSGDAASRQIPSSIRDIVGDVVNSSLILGDYGQANRELNKAISRNKYPSAVRNSSRAVYDYIMKNRGSFQSRAVGGVIPYGQGGPTMGPVQQAIPAILHGGEYVVRNSAVKKYGSGMMEQINQGTFKPKEYFLGGIVDKAKKTVAKVISSAGKSIKNFQNFSAKPDSELSKPLRNLKTGLGAFKPTMDFLTPAGGAYFGMEGLGSDNVFLNSLIAASAMAPTSTIFAPAGGAAKTAGKSPKIINTIKKLRPKGNKNAGKFMPGKTPIDSTLETVAENIASSMPVDISNPFWKGLSRGRDNFVPFIDPDPFMRGVMPSNGINIPLDEFGLALKQMEVLKAETKNMIDIFNKTPVIPSEDMSLFFAKNEEMNRLAKKFPGLFPDFFEPVAEAMSESRRVINKLEPNMALPTKLEDMRRIEPDLEEVSRIIERGRKGSPVGEDRVGNIASYFSGTPVEESSNMWSNKWFAFVEQMKKQRDQFILAKDKDAVKTLRTNFFERMISASWGGDLYGVAAPEKRGLGGTFGGAFDLAMSISKLGIPFDNGSYLFRGLQHLDMQRDTPWVKKLLDEGSLNVGDTIPHIGAVRTSGSLSSVQGFISPSVFADEGALLVIKIQDQLRAAFSNSFPHETEALFPGLSELVVAAPIQKLQFGDQVRYIIPTLLRRMFDPDNFDISKFERITGARGGNPGGVYRAPNGVQFYIKEAVSEAVAKNEELASRIYELLGLSTAGQRAVKGVDGKTYLMSMMKEYTDIGNDVLSGALDPSDTRVLGLDLATHALLGNYDVVGRSFDNLGLEITKMNDFSSVTKSFVVDPGASLFYRGTGATKERTEFEFGGNATKTLFDLIINNRGIKQPYLQNANTLFGNISVNDLVISIQKVDHEFSKMREHIEESVSLAYDNPNEIAYVMTQLKNRMSSLKKLNDDILNSSKIVPMDTDLDMSVTDFFQSFPQLLNRFNGGIVPRFESQGVPAMLHGGEYVVNAKAVKNIGFAALEAMNNMRYSTPKSPNYSGVVNQPTSSNSNVHIYVDNFIGERAWFESMMKDYNVKVAPQNQKSAGLNNTTISTYSGINRGL